MCFIWLFVNAPGLFSLQEMKAAAEPCVREFWACSWELQWFRLGDTCVLAVFLQDECLRVEIVFKDDVAGLYVNRPLLYMHRVCLESWIGPKGDLSRSRHDPRTWNCRLACMIIIKKTRHGGKNPALQNFLRGLKFCYILLGWDFLIPSDVLWALHHGQ